MANLLAVTFPRSATSAILAARIGMTNVTIVSLPTNFASTFAWLLTVSVSGAAVLCANCYTRIAIGKQIYERTQSTTIAKMLTNVTQNSRPAFVAFTFQWFGA